MLISVSAAYQHYSWITQSTTRRSLLVRMYSLVRPICTCCQTGPHPLIVTKPALGLIHTLKRMKQEIVEQDTRPWCFIGDPWLSWVFLSVLLELPSPRKENPDPDQQIRVLIQHVECMSRLIPFCHCRPLKIIMMMMTTPTKTTTMMLMTMTVIILTKILCFEGDDGNSRWWGIRMHWRGALFKSCSSTINRFSPMNRSTKRHINIIIWSLSDLDEGF